MGKKIVSILLILIAAISVLSMSSCSGAAPELSDVKDRLIYLIESSKEVNVLFFGKGLPVYERDDLLSSELGVYYNDELTSHNTLMPNSSLISIDEIKAYAERVYSKDYLSAVYETAFDGYMTGSSSAYLRFFENSNGLYQSINARDFGLFERIYDYSTMEIVKPSNGEYINITVDSYTLEDREPKPTSLAFIFERGNWYLDSPTY